MGTKYVDQGIEYNDLSTTTVQSLTTLNTETPGVYTITYNVTDALVIKGLSRVIFM